MKIRINKITMLLLSVFAVIVLRCNTDAYAATAAPYPVIINNNATVTTSTRVRLALTSGAAVAMRLGNTLAEMNTASWEPCVTSKIWRLSAGTGMKTVYVQFKDAAGVTTTTNIVASIKLNDLPKAVIVGKNVAGQLLVGRYDGTTLNTSAWASGTDQDLSHWRMVCAADVTGDGVDDLVGLKSDGSLAVWSSSRSGFTFSTGGTIGTLALKELQAADYDADGKIDIAGRTDAGAIYVLRSSGSGFITKQWGAWPVPVTDMQAGDVNGDGMGDLVARDVNNNIYVARSAGTGFFVDKKAWGAWPKGVSSIQPADVNGDGMMDLVGYDAASGSLYAALSDGAKFTVQNWGTLGGPVNGPIYDLQAADINGDGKADMVARCFNGDWYVARSDGSKFNTEYLGGWSCVDWHDVQVADINGDGVSDIIGRNDDNEWYALLSDGSLFKTVYLGGWAAGCWMNVIAANFSDQSYTAVPAFSRKASVPDTTPPTGNISINNGASTTALASVTLTIDGSDTQTGVARMRVANASASLVTALWEPFAATKAWTVAAGLGAKNVYVQLQDGAGNISTTSISDSVEGFLRRHLR